MSYEEKARAATAALKGQAPLDCCPQCGGYDVHTVECPMLLALPRVATPTLEQVKRAHVLHVLGLANWHKSKAARALGIDRRTLYHLIERYQLEDPSK